LTWKWSFIGKLKSYKKKLTMEFWCWGLSLSLTSISSTRVYALENASSLLALMSIHSGTVEGGGIVLDTGFMILHNCSIFTSIP
jgi:hypothetical protein